MQNFYLAPFFLPQNEIMDHQPSYFMPQLTHLVYFSWTSSDFNHNLGSQKNNQTTQINILLPAPQKMKNRESLNLRREQNQQQKKNSKKAESPKEQKQRRNKTIKNKEKALPKELRNIIPNIIHQIFCYINKKSRSGRIVKSYLSNENVENEKKFQFQRFYLYHKLLKEKINHYMNIKALKELNKFQQPQCQIYSQKQQINFLTMNRILINHFLHHQFQTNILTSSRMQSETRLWHLVKKRHILEQLMDKLRTF